jgi:hypothetical protein
MSSLWIWGVALLVYGVFRLWYDNWRGPLSEEEVAGYLEKLEMRSELEPSRLAVVREFLESDDGKEFYMVNLIKTHQEPVPVPGTSEQRPGPEVLKGYTDHFMPALFRRAGHPAFAGPAAGGYLEQWGVEQNPGWTFSGVIRYRSRRDMIELATDPKFEPAHAYKLAAMANTLAFPVTARLFVGPRVWVGLVVCLAAALGRMAVSAGR